MSVSTCANCNNSSHEVVFSSLFNKIHLVEHEVTVIEAIAQLFGVGDELKCLVDMFQEEDVPQLCQACLQILKNCLTFKNEFLSLCHSNGTLGSILVKSADHTCLKQEQMDYSDETVNETSYQSKFQLKDCSVLVRKLPYIYNCKETFSELQLNSTIKIEAVSTSTIESTVSETVLGAWNVAYDAEDDHCDQLDNTTECDPLVVDNLNRPMTRSTKKSRFTGTKQICESQSSVTHKRGSGRPRMPKRVQVNQMERCPAQVDFEEFRELVFIRLANSEGFLGQREMEQLGRVPPEDLRKYFESNRPLYQLALDEQVRHAQARCTIGNALRDYFGLGEVATSSTVASPDSDDNFAYADSDSTFEEMRKGSNLENLDPSISEWDREAIVAVDGREIARLGEMVVNITDEEERRQVEDALADEIDFTRPFNPPQLGPPNDSDREHGFRSHLRLDMHGLYWCRYYNCNRCNKNLWKMTKHWKDDHRQEAFRNCPMCGHKEVQNHSCKKIHPSPPEGEPRTKNYYWCTCRQRFKTPKGRQDHWDYVARDRERHPNTVPIVGPHWMNTDPNYQPWLTSGPEHERPSSQLEVKPHRYLKSKLKTATPQPSTDDSSDEVQPKKSKKKGQPKRK